MQSKGSCFLGVLSQRLECPTIAACHLCTIHKQKCQSTNLKRFINEYSPLVGCAHAVFVVNNKNNLQEFHKPPSITEQGAIDKLLFFLSILRHFRLNFPQVCFAEEEKKQLTN